MFDKNNFFKNSPFLSKQVNKNITKVRKTFNELKTDYNNFEIPLLTSYEKSYNFDFSESLVTRFSKYKNIIIFGMGGSILGTKSIYSFFKKKNQKKDIFF